MKIKIKETGEIEELILIGKDGIRWESDLIGNHGGIKEYDEDNIAIMSQDDFDWWDDLIKRYQIADDRYEELKAEIEIEEEDDFYKYFGDVGDGDLEDYPERLQSTIDSWVAKKQKENENE